MMETLEQVRAPEKKALPEDGEMLLRLNRSFETFIGITGELKSAYERLRERAEQVDLQLQQANARLSEKVRELDGMTRRLNDLIEHLPSAVVAVDEGGRITHFNRAAEELFGVDASSVVGRPAGRVAALRGLSLLAGRGTGGEEEGRERILHTPDGRRLVVTARIAELRDGAGRPAGRIEILADLTETDRLRREVHRLDTLAAMGEMAAAVAHQIRNPLNGVEGFASLLLRGLEKPEADLPGLVRYARNIVRGVREVNAVIQGMLMLARPEKLLLRPVDVESLALEAARSLEERIEHSCCGATVEFRPGEGDTRVSGDGLKLKQVFLNLAHNALEAVERTAEGPRRIRIRTRRRDGSVEFIVTDTGCGIDPEGAGKLFRPFFTTRADGIGLGLSVAAKIVELHGGRITMRSLAGTGTAFKVRLRALASAEQGSEGERE